MLLCSFWRYTLSSHRRRSIRVFGALTSSGGRGCGCDSLFPWMQDYQQDLPTTQVLPGIQDPVGGHLSGGGGEAGGWGRRPCSLRGPLHTQRVGKWPARGCSHAPPLGCEVALRGQPARCWTESLPGLPRKGPAGGVGTGCGVSPHRKTRSRLYVTPPQACTPGTLPGAPPPPSVTPGT